MRGLGIIYCIQAIENIEQRAVKEIIMMFPH